MVLSSRGILKCIVIGEENTWQGAAASSALAACSAPTAVRLSAVDLGLGLKREAHDQLARADGGASCRIFPLLFKAAIAWRWRRMTPIARAAIMANKNPSTTIAGIETRWVDIGVVTTVL